jgi:carbamoyl-phosphate synthase large subunit
VDLEREIAVAGKFDTALLTKAKQYGFSDKQLADLTGKNEEEVSAMRKAAKLSPDFKLVDTCAAEFQAHTPYYYSTYDTNQRA